MSPELIVLAAKEVAAAINKVAGQNPDYKEDQFKNLFELRKTINEEKARPDRDHDDLINWVGIRWLFVDTVIKEISK